MAEEREGGKLESLPNVASRKHGTCSDAGGGVWLGVHDRGRLMGRLVEVGGWTVRLKLLAA